MLEQLMRLIGVGGVVQLEALSRQLDVSRPLLEAMLSDLERMGYLRLLGGGCAGECGHCGVDAGCSILGAGKVWVLTDRGNVAIDRLSA